MLIQKDFFKGKARDVAKKLLGKTIEINGIKGIITETEAYEDDEASHAFKKTKRSEIMYDGYGKIYVYLIYGMHYCLNITCDEKGPGAVLIRGIGDIKGPGRVCNFFKIDKSFNYTELNDKVKVYDNDMKFKIKSSERIGISKARDLKWRFFIQKTH